MIDVHLLIEFNEKDTVFTVKFFGDRVSNNIFHSVRKFPSYHDPCLLLVSCPHSLLQQLYDIRSFLQKSIKN